jgi:flagellar basal-body rod protein FlgB
VYIFDLAAQHMQWIAARQQATASNIANIDTPGYRARDVAPFEAVLEHTALDLTASNAAHLRLEQAAIQTVDTAPGASWDTSHSGNSVTLEAELLKVGENGRMQAFDTNLQRVFQRMLLSSLKV